MHAFLATNTLSFPALDKTDVLALACIVLFSATVPALAAWLGRKLADFKKACDEFESNMRGW